MSAAVTTTTTTPRAALLVDWPAPQLVMDAARGFLLGVDHAIIACDHDVDGLASAVLIARGIERLGGQADIEPVHRGEHVHRREYVERLNKQARPTTSFIVTDMGSRAERIGFNRSTMVIDHHDADAFPPDALVVSASRRIPVAPTSYLAFEILRPIVSPSIENLTWLALLGSVADLGSGATFGDLPMWRSQYRVKDISESIALLNAARRAASHDVATSLSVLRNASSPREIAEGTIPGVDRLREHRAEVSAEVNRVARVAPRVLTPKSGPKVALIRFASKAQIHPLVGMRWKTRLAGGIVLAANEGFPTDDRVSFVVRSTRPMDLLKWLREMAAPLGDMGPDFARGHPSATGGNLSRTNFDRLVAELGGIENQRSRT